MKLLQDIDKAKHIVIKAENDFLASASALYTYILRLHKKVSLVCISENIDDKLSFLPWFDKIKSIGSLSADLNISLDITSLQLYELFKRNAIKPNQKMATALYAGVLKETDGFLNHSVNGTQFAVAKELIEFGADNKICTDSILKSTTLSLLRLKATMLKNMILADDAQVAIMKISDDELRATGATQEDCNEILQEAMKLPYVNEIVLVKSDEQNKVLKKIKKEF